MFVVAVRQAVDAYRVSVSRAKKAATREKVTLLAVASAGAPPLEEAAYFYPDANGNRSAMFIFDMEDSWQMIPTVEPLFSNLDAAVHLSPVMNGEDLQRGFQEAGA
jgi:hypothetical protein